MAGPVLGHFGTLDTRINADMVGGFEAATSQVVLDRKSEVAETRDKYECLQDSED